MLTQEDKTKAEMVLLLLWLLAVAFVCLMAVRIESKYNDAVIKLNECKNNKTMPWKFISNNEVKPVWEQKGNGYLP